MAKQPDVSLNLLAVALEAVECEGAFPPNLRGAVEMEKAARRCVSDLTSAILCAMSVTNSQKSRVLSFDSF